MLVVSVTTYEDSISSSGEIITSYVVVVSYDTLNYIILKRYSEFSQLYLNLKDSYRQLDDYKFPNKSLFNNSANFTKDRRLRGFDELLNILSKLRPLPILYQDFLELPERLQKENQLSEKKSKSRHNFRIRSDSDITSPPNSPSKGIMLSHSASSYDDYHSFYMDEQEDSHKLYPATSKMNLNEEIKRKIEIETNESSFVTLVYCSTSHHRHLNHDNIAVENSGHIKKLEHGFEKANEGIMAISKEWSIDLYPKFLKSCAMQKHSWELMKYKYMQRILRALESNKRQEFIISFLGSSVSAGHDSPYINSAPIVAGQYMRDVFDGMNIELISRNVALGNNPCTPYDVCVKYFAGLDADIVHWEQTYFCHESPIFEQFIRQALTSPAKPLVVFSQSDTAHWPASKCDVQPPPHVLTEEEKILLKSDPVHIVSESNKDEFKKWDQISKLHSKYKMAGIQTFGHNSHDVYACLGPYIRDWEKGAASWHPSIIAHRLRAAHHAYFWLNAYREAIIDLANLLNHKQFHIVENEVNQYLNKTYSVHVEQIDKVYPTKYFIDGMKCYTDYEPKTEKINTSLKEIVISGYIDE
eukprot:gene9356-12606_t